MLILTCKNNNIARSMIDNTWSSQLSVSFIIVWPFIEFIVVFWDLCVLRVCYSCWTFWLFAVECFEWIEKFELYMFSVKWPMINTSRIIITKINTKKSLLFHIICNQIMRKWVTWSLPKPFNHFQSAWVKYCSIGTLMIKPITTNSHFSRNNQPYSSIIVHNLTGIKSVNIQIIHIGINRFPLFLTSIVCAFD